MFDDISDQVIEHANSARLILNRSNEDIPDERALKASKMLENVVKVLQSEPMKNPGETSKSQQKRIKASK